MGNLFTILSIKKRLIVKLSNCQIAQTQRTKQCNSVTACPKLLHRCRRVQHGNLGFTLIELLVAIAVIGILSTGLIVAVNPVTQLQKSRDSKRIESLKQMKAALELYHQDYGRYPLQGTNYTIKDASSGLDVMWGTAWSPYMKNLPTDPTGKEYRYWVDESPTGQGQSYAIYASLDRAENTCAGVQTQACSAAGSRVGSATGTPAAYNYAITSDNISP